MDRNWGFWEAVAAFLFCLGLLSAVMDGLHGKVREHIEQVDE